MRQMLPSEGEDEEEIHYSAAPSRTNAHTQPNRASLFPHLHHREEVRGSSVGLPPTAPPIYHAGCPRALPQPHLRRLCIRLKTAY